MVTGGPLSSDGEYDLPGSGQWIVGACHNCGRTFWSNPDTVPSTRLADGCQVMFCEPCILAANPIRIAAGLAPVRIIPGTYP